MSVQMFKSKMKIMMLLIIGLLVMIGGVGLWVEYGTAMRARSAFYNYADDLQLKYANVSAMIDSDGDGFSTVTYSVEGGETKPLLCTTSVASFFFSFALQGCKPVDTLKALTNPPK